MGMIKLPNEAINFFKKNVVTIFENGSLAEGPWNKKVEDIIIDYTNAKSALTSSSNGSGLLAILECLKYAKGYKSIFLQSNTMYGMKTLAKSSGLDLLGFVPSSLDTLMPTIDQVKDFIKSIEHPESSVFLLTHIGGWTNPDIHEILDVCNENGVAVVEDCAHSLGSRLNEKHTGLYGVAGVYSLYATKSIPVGEGGIIITQDEELGDLLKRYSIYDRFEQKLDFGFNNRMSEINALLTCSVLIHLESIIENKYSIAHQYIDICESEGIKYLDPRYINQRSNLYKFIIFDGPNYQLSSIKNVTSPVYNYSLGLDPEGIVENHACLPIWYALEQDNIDEFLNEFKQLKKYQ